MKSKTIGRVKESFRNLFESLSNELRFPGRASKRKTIDVSWPQSVVKTVEAGASIERPVEIQNAHERLVLQQRNVPTEPGGREQPEVIQYRGDIARNETVDVHRRSAVKFVDDPHGHTLYGVEGSGQGSVVNVTEDVDTNTHSSIHTLSAQESMSDQRSSWHQSALRVQATVSQIRLMKPQVREIQRSIPPNYNNDASPPTSPQISADMDTSTPSNSDFLFPRAVAVKRDAWRYSVNAVNACNKEREENSYSLPGDGFAELQKSREIKDPEVLKKVTELRRQEISPQKVGKTSYSRGVFQQSETKFVQKPTAENVKELGRINPPIKSSGRGDQVNRNSIPNVNTTATTSKTLPTSLGILSSRHSQPSNPMANSSTMEKSTTPTPDSTIAIRTPRHQTSISSNVRTPNGYYPADYEAIDRIQVQAYPRISRVEQGNRGRQNIIDRWTTEKLKQRRLEGRGLEIVQNNGKVWRTADVIFGKLKYADEPPIVRVKPVTGSSVSQQQPNGVPPMGMETKLRKAAPVPQNSPAVASFSDLLSTSTYPRRLPQDAQLLPPQPSRVIVSHRKIPQPQTIPELRRGRGG